MGFQKRFENFVQRLVQNPVKHPRWNEKVETAKVINSFHKNLHHWCLAEIWVHFWLIRNQATSWPARIAWSLELSQIIGKRATVDKENIKTITHNDILQTVLLT